MADIPPIDVGATLWSTQPDVRTDTPLLVLLHGYGADERDLFGLVPHLPEAFSMAAVRAPLSPPWPAPGWSWFPIEQSDADGVSAAARRVIEWVDAAVSPNRLIGLLGFSQGGAVSLQAMRLEPTLFAFAVNLSGFAAPGEILGDAELATRRPPVFWGRGTHDEVIPTHLIAHTTEWLPAHSELSGRVYDGLAHGVSEEELSDVREFLLRRLPQP